MDGKSRGKQTVRWIIPEVYNLGTERESRRLGFKALTKAVMIIGLILYCSEKGTCKAGRWSMGAEMLGVVALQDCTCCLTASA